MKYLMKKPFLLFIIYIFTWMLPAASCYAADTDSSLVIDNTHIYPGMKNSYQEGYTPVISGNTLTLAVPLLPQAEIRGNQITGKVIYEEGDASPFIKKNYIKTVRKQPYQFNTVVDAYLFQLDIQLQEDRENGQYPITLEVQGMLSDNRAFRQAFTLYVQITDGKTKLLDTQAEASEIAPVSEVFPENSEDPFYPDPTDDNSRSSDHSDPISHQPKLLLESYEADAVPLVSGTATPLKLLFRNTNPGSSIENIKIGMDCETNDIIFDKNSHYVNKIGSQGLCEINVTGTIARDCLEGSIRIVFSLEYEDSRGEAYTETEYLLLPLKQPLQVELGPLQLPDTLYAAETVTPGVQVMNLSRNEVYNVRVELEAPGLSPMGTMFIGNMEAGSSQEAAINTYVGTLNSQGDKYGRTTGILTLIYEDRFGEEFRETQSFQADIQEPQVLLPVIKEASQKTENQWWISLLIALLFLCGIAGFLIVKHHLTAQGGEADNVSTDSIL